MLSIKKGPPSEPSLGTTVPCGLPRFYEAGGPVRFYRLLIQFSDRSDWWVLGKHRTQLDHIKYAKLHRYVHHAEVTVANR